MVKRKNSLDGIRRRADLRHLLDRLGIEPEDRGNELVLRCVSGEHEDRNPSLRLRDDPGTERHGLAHCFSCKWGGSVFDIVMARNGCDLSTAVEFVRGSIGKAKLKRGDSGSLDGPPLPERPAGLRQVVPGSRCAEYLRGRGVGLEDVVKWRLLDWPWKRRVWVPIHMGGELVHWLARAYDGGKPKVLTPDKDASDHGGAVFGYDQVRPGCELHVAEGWLSAVRLCQAGFNAVALCGSNPTDRQVEALLCLHPERVVVWKEGDVAGKIMAKKVSVWLRRQCPVRVVGLPVGKDPADFSVTKVVQFFKRAK